MSRRTILRSSQFKDDLVRIYRHIRRQSESGADKAFDAVRRSVEALADMPGVGRRWESPDPRLDGMRVTVVTPYRNYLIFFRATAESVEVFRVVHGAQELQRIVDESDLDDT